MPTAVQSVECWRRAVRRSGTRNKFSAQFVADIAQVWERHGSAVLERLVVEEPARFADICSRLIPRDVAVSIEQRLPGGLDEADLEILRAIKAAIPDAGKRQPGEVTLDAIRAHGSKLIENNCS